MRKTFIFALLAVSLLNCPESRGASPLAAPDGVRVKPGIGEATLEWQPTSGADGYMICWEKAAAVTLASPCLESISGGIVHYQVKDLTPGVQYNFTVSALRGEEESSLSRQVGVIPSAGEKILAKDGAP